MKNLLLGIVALIVVFGGWYLYKRGAPAPAPVSNNATTTATTTGETGSTTTPSGTVNRAVGSLATSNDIVIDTPKQGANVTSPITVSGKARGNWYFEASAPVVVIDTQGNTLGEGHIQATGDWMTTNFVPFKGTITYTHATGTVAGALVFLNDNPSGQASTSKYMVVPVFFK